MIVGLCSSYLEGPLVQGAVASLVECCDRVAVFEGPAGEPLTVEVPPTDLGEWSRLPQLTYRDGRWRTDARKRQAMLEWAQQLHRQEAPAEPLWGVIVDADEVLMNAVYLPDWLRRLDYHEEVSPESQYVGRPMRLVELDGATSWVRGRLLRLDRIREYKVSTSVFVTIDGTTYTGGGNVEDKVSEWAGPRKVYFESDRMLFTPGMLTDPYLVHRSILRHPLRSGLRLHEQEREELIRVGLPV